MYNDLILKKLEQIAKVYSEKGTNKQLVRASENFLLSLSMFSSNLISESEFEEQISLFIEVLVEKTLSEFEKRNPFFLEIHSGSGGTDSQDWAEMLLKMYFGFLEKNKIKYELVEKQNASDYGIKSAILKIHLPLYSFIGEAGVHRLVRISPFNAQSKRHTSFASVYLYPHFSAEESQIKIDEKDLKIDVFRASGAGGQHVNKTESAVRIRHLPTNTVVQCQNERSQHQNKATAMEMLISILEEKSRERIDKAKNQLEKTEATWSNQFRSYVLDPYKTIKDSRSDFEVNSAVAVQKFLSGNIKEFLDKHLIILLEEKIKSLE